MKPASILTVRTVELAVRVYILGWEQAGGTLDAAFWTTCERDINRMMCLHSRVRHLPEVIAGIVGQFRARRT